MNDKLTTFIMMPSWKHLLFGEHGLCSYLDESFKKSLIDLLSKSENPSKKTKQNLTKYDDLLMNILCVIVGKIFDRHHQLTDGLDNAKKTISENKIKYDSEIKDRKRCVHEVEVKLNKSKKRIVELTKINSECQLDNENLQKTIQEKDLLIKDFKTNIKDLSATVKKLESEQNESNKKFENFKTDKRKIVTELEKKLSDSNKKVKKMINFESKFLKSEALHKKDQEENLLLQKKLESKLLKSEQSMKKMEEIMAKFDKDKIISIFEEKIEELERKYEKDYERLDQIEETLNKMDTQKIREVFGKLAKNPKHQKIVAKNIKNQRVAKCKNGPATNVAWFLKPEAKDNILQQKPTDHREER